MADALEREVVRMAGRRLAARHRRWDSARSGGRDRRPGSVVRGRGSFDGDGTPDLAVADTRSNDALANAGQRRRNLPGVAAHSCLREPECRHAFTLKSLAAFSPRSFCFSSGPRSDRPATVETESGHMQSKWA